MITSDLSRQKQADVGTLNGLSIEALTELLLPTIVAGTQQQLQPLITETNNSIQQSLARYSDDVANNVMPQVAMAVQVTQTIEAWLRNASKAAYGGATFGADQMD